MSVITRERPVQNQRLTERQHEPSSIGVIGIVETQRGEVNRRKGFITSVVETEDQLRYFREHFINEEIARMNNSPELADITRLTVRAVVNADLLSHGRDRDHIEAIINIGSVKGQGNYAIVYFGYNKVGRQLSSEQRDDYNRRLMLTNLSRDVGNLSGILSSPNYRGYTISRLDTETLTQDQREGIDEMLRDSFKYSENDGDRMLADSRNIFFIATTATGQVVGMSMAERRTVALNNGESITIAEVTNATVIQGHGGNGLYGAISAHLIRHIAEDRDPATRVDLVYSESNMERQTLLNAIAMQHRTYAGILPNNSFVDNGLKTMMVTYLNRQELDFLYLGEVNRLRRGE